MSVHAMIAAAYLEDLPQTTKLVLMAIADSSDEHTLEAAPGLPKLRAWSGLSRSRALGVVAELKAAGYVEHLTAGRAGRRAVYRVFPAGVPAIPHPSEVAARYAEDLSTAVDNPVDNPGIEGPTGRTLDPAQGPKSGPQGPTATGPLQSSTSVHSGTTPRKPVDTGPAPTPSSRPSPGGFPGARSNGPDVVDVSAGKRARGGHNLPCPFHADQIAGACGRCAHAAAESDPAKVAEARARARAALRPTSSTDSTATPTTATEEKSA